MTGLLEDKQRLLHGLVLAVWATQPFTVGPLLEEALSDRSDPFRSAASAEVWAWWFVVLLALTVARPITLTIARIGAPAALPAAVWAAIEADSSVTILVGLISAAVASFAVLLPSVGERFVDGIGYGDEKRFLLRPPGPIVLFVLTPTWALTVAGFATGPLLLADKRWVAGGIALLLGLPGALLGLRAIHRLTARFLVFVPNGLVVHDGSVLREPVLFGTREIAGLGPATVDTAATDLSAQALGLALELKLHEPAKLPVVVDRSTTAEEMVSSMLLSPSRPAAVMRAAHERGVSIA